MGGAEIPVSENTESVDTPSDTSSTMISFWVGILTDSYVEFVLHQTSRIILRYMSFV